MKKLMVTVFAICMSACAADPAATARDDGQTTTLASSQLEAQPAPQESLVVTDDAADASPIEDVIQPRAGCSVVQFCNAPGSDGTRCLQQGCTFDQAFNECVNETATVCGAATCPWIIVRNDGARFFIVPCP